MWVMMNDSALSIVEDRGDSSRLMVRARFAGDIERVFPGADVIRTDDADYLFRAFLPRQDVVAAIACRLSQIWYGDFKGSVMERDRHDAYSDIWHIMNRAQARRKFADDRLHGSH